MWLQYDYGDGPVIDGVKTVLFVEDHLPGYLAEYLRIMTDPDAPEDQQIVNRKALHYTFRWVAEEDRHAHVLEMYLTRTGLVKPAELEQDMLRERQTGYAFPYHQMVEGFIYLALQEKATHLYYRALAKDIEEPLLKAILGRMGADEASHGAFFYDLLIKCHKGDLDALSKKPTWATGPPKEVAPSRRATVRTSVAAVSLVWRRASRAALRARRARSPSARG